MRLVATGLVTGTQSVEVFTIASGALDELPGVERFSQSEVEGRPT